MGPRHIVIAALAAIAPFTQATQLFSNTGTLSGWSAINQEHNGVVQSVSNVVYEGLTALKMTQTYDASYQGRYHSEVVRDNGYSKGDTRFYGFAFRLSETWEFTPNEGYNIAQFIGNFNGLTTCDDWMPSTMVWISGTRLYTRLKSGEVCAQVTTSIDTGRDVTAGVWHKIIIQAKWASDNTGYFKLWYDGDKVVERYDVPTTVSNNVPFQFRVGLYANSWFDNNHKMKGTQGFRQVWFDEIAFGTTFADADPAQW